MTLGQIKEREERVLKMADNSVMPISLLVMSMLSDAQEAMHFGQVDMANEILNEAKIIINHRLSKKDEHGRHI